MADNWRDSEAVQRGVLREVNERIALLSRQFTKQNTNPSVQFVCECSDPTCSEPVIVGLELYERVRSGPRRYLIVMNHEDPETETVIVAGERYAIVEALAGSASKIAESTDPRRSARLAELNGDRRRTLLDAANAMETPVRPGRRSS